MHGKVRCALLHNKSHLHAATNAELVINPGALVDYVTVHVLGPLVQHAIPGPLPDATPPTLADVVSGQAPLLAFVQQQWQGQTRERRAVVAAAAVTLAGTALVAAVRWARRT